jgi:predicted ATPase
MSANKIISLVEKNENRLRLNEDALKVIENIKGDIGVCLIAGANKSGKSYLLNNLTGIKNTLETGHTDEVKAKAIWMNTETVKVRKNNGPNEEINVIYMNTEVIYKLILSNRLFL